ncbi:MAG: undecaprenyl/decaprenyl-phosphate alpha-N-acetylglucosaminyl 1-phosphate transferase [Limnochordia bacterium]|jgi:UDP-GlcNAc:undecaprenyl-phosphate GlcNAc-1-phosphate transferase|nr:undecaprenyl/decaprenyl-phosphate alpha-N-acetylglucosaminyl 1-phosphate transferase [Limnochordia bacterium]
MLKVAMLSFCLSALCSGLLYLWAPRLKLVDEPNDRRMNRIPLANGGGIAIVLGVLSTFLLNRWGSVFNILPVILILGLGVYDDIYELRPLPKLIGQIIIAVIAVAGGVLIESVTSPFTGQAYILGWLAYPLTVIWIVAVVNVMNIVDGLDGLTGGISLSICLFLYISLKGLSLDHDSVLVVSTAAAVSGFLPFNFPRAKLILGDAGAMSLGFMLAVLLSRLSRAQAFNPAVIFIVLAVPILDTCWAIYRRTCRGIPFYIGDREHVHHRLAQKMGSSATASALLITVSFLGSGVALGLGYIPVWMSPLAALLIAYAYTQVALWLGVIPTEAWDKETVYTRAFRRGGSQ